ncbi:MAG: T9SS type A sorting domain-containing protein, partial [Bacteroidales bacterium]|nr:T9SS type A sorting domain-containing protein [Bacteroidales bacterium]
SHEVNVSEFKSGIYFVQILTDKGMETRRIQVQK